MSFSFEKSFCGSKLPRFAVFFAFVLCEGIARLHQQLRIDVSIKFNAFWSLRMQN